MYKMNLLRRLLLYNQIFCTARTEAVIFESASVIVSVIVSNSDVISLPTRLYESAIASI